MRTSRIRVTLSFQDGTPGRTRDITTEMSRLNYIQSLKSWLFDQVNDDDTPVTLDHAKYVLKMFDFLGEADRVEVTYRDETKLVVTEYQEEVPQ